MPGYCLLASPTLYPGQTVHAAVLSADSNTKPINVGILIQSYGEADTLISHSGPSTNLLAGEAAHLEWQIPDLKGAPIVRAGILVSSDDSSEGMIHLDYLSWDGAPNVIFCRPAAAGEMWKRQWVNAADYFETEAEESFRVIQNRGRGLVITGSREWSDYSVQATITPHLAKAFGLAARVQGQERYYALLLSEGNWIKLIKRLEGETVLTEQMYSWEFGKPYRLRMDVQENRIRAWVNGKPLFAVDDPGNFLFNGGIALVCEEGRLGTESIVVMSGPSSDRVE